MTIYLVNDKQFLNTQYRSDLINLLQKKRGQKFVNMGLFDGHFSLFNFLIRVLFQKSTLIISSNLRANLVNLSLIWKSRIIILNGLGRYRKIRLLRKYILSCMVFSKRGTKLLVQNYADFRYFRRYGKKRFFIEWTPGSGGRRRKVGNDNSSISIITRDTKINLQLESINEFLEKVCGDQKIWIIGTNKFSFGSSLKTNKVTFTGKVPQQNILAYSSKLFVPDGYGEGIPHSLVDAIVSGVSIYISKRNYIRFGLYLFLGPKDRAFLSDYVYIKEVSKLSSVYEMSSVNDKLIAMIDSHLRFY